MIIFESILTTFEASFIFWASWGSIENWLELKIEPPLANLALLNPWNTLYKKHFFQILTKSYMLCEVIKSVAGQNFSNLHNINHKSLTLSLDLDVNLIEKINWS